VGRRPSERSAAPPPGTTWPLPVLPVAAGTLLYRLTRTHHPDPAFFGRLRTYRFDAPDGSYGVCYLGTTLACCLLEVLVPLRHPDTARRFVTEAQIRSYYAAVATTTRPLRLAYLADDGLAQLAVLC